MKFRCAGIVLYNPDVGRLLENYRSIAEQVDSIIMIDNNSDNINCIRQAFSGKENITLIENSENRGVAAALNQMAEIAIRNGFDWIYLLDQDSVSSPDVMDSYQGFIHNDDVALLTPFIIDINKTSLEEYCKLKLHEVTEVDWAITSGTLIRLDVWRKIGKFSEDLFIDAVDMDYSIRLKINGYRQLRVNKEYLLQEVGRAEPTMIFRPHKDNAGKWTVKRYYRTNHSLMRQYYMVRNHIIIARKYRRYRSVFKGYLFVILFTLPKLVFERNRLKLFKEIVKGTRDGFKYDVSVY